MEAENDAEAQSVATAINKLSPASRTIDGGAFMDSFILNYMHGGNNSDLESDDGKDDNTISDLDLDYSLCSDEGDNDHGTEAVGIENVLRSVDTDCTK